MAKPEHHIGKSSGRKGVISETTGDIKNLTASALSHWGKEVTYDSTHKMQSSDERKGKSSQSPLLDNSSHGSESDDESEEPVATKEF